MLKVLAAIIAMLVTVPLMATTLDLCVENPAGLDRATLQVFRAELAAILDASNSGASFSACHAGSVTITFQNEPPEAEPSALGATRSRNGRLVGEIAVFVAPTAGIVRTRLPAPLGRALARVATHELGHWLTQRSEHAARGLMVERFSAAHLMAASRASFRLPLPR